MLATTIFSEPPLSLSFMVVPCLNNQYNYWGGKLHCCTFSNQIGFYSIAPSKVCDALVNVAQLPQTKRKLVTWLLAEGQENLRGNIHLSSSNTYKFFCYLLKAIRRCGFFFMYWCFELVTESCTWKWFFSPGKPILK